MNKLDPEFDLRRVLFVALFGFAAVVSAYAGDLVMLTAGVLGFATSLAWLVMGQVIQVVEHIREKESRL